MRHCVLNLSQFQLKQPRFKKTYKKLQPPLK